MAGLHQIAICSSGLEIGCCLLDSFRIQKRPGRSLRHSLHQQNYNFFLEFTFLKFIQINSLLNYIKKKLKKLIRNIKLGKKKFR